MSAEPGQAHLYYAFSRIGLSYGWNRLYDLTAQRHVYSSLGPIWWFPLPYTPPMAWLTAPLTMFPLRAAYWLWAIIIFAAYLAAWWLAAPRDPALRVLCLVAPLGLYMVWLGLALGQVIALQMLCVAAAYWLLQRGQDVWAGVALLGVLIHPQGLFLVPLVVLAAGRWKTFISFAVGSAVVGLATAVALGWDGMIAFVGRLQEAQSNSTAFYVPPWISFSNLLKARPAYALVAQLCLSGIVLLAARRHRAKGMEIRVTLGLIGSVLVTSFIHLDDLMVLVLAAWLTMRVWPDIRVVTLFAVAYWVGLLQTDVGTVHYGRLIIVVELIWLMALALLPVPVELRDWARRTLRPSASMPRWRRQRTA